MFIGMQGFGNLVGSPLLGYIAEQYGYALMYCAGAGLAFVGLALFFRQQWFSNAHEVSEE